MKRKITLAAAVAVITTLIYFYPAGSPMSSRAETVEGASHAAVPGEVVYNFDTCGNCHAVPDIAGRDLGVEERAQCDACHGENNSVIVAASTTRAKTPATSGSKKKKVWEQDKEPAGLGTMVYIPAGEFIQGTNSRHADEGPEHTVYLDGYYMDLYEVTNYEYKLFIDATGHRKPPHWITGTYPKGKKYHPVVYVDMFDGQAYCRRAGKRLPTESEWEKAARGTDGRVHPWGNIFDKEKGNVVALGIKDTTPVGAFEEGRSPYGLYDMIGNAWEWTSTWFYPYEGAEIPEKDEYYLKKVVTLKGGSWFDCSAYSCGMSAYTFNRSQFSPTVKNNSFGFRCAKDGDGEGAE